MNIRRKLFPVMPILMLLAGASIAETLPAIDHYGKWMLACDNALSCEARGMENQRVPTHLSVKREAGPEGTLRISIGASFRFGPDDLGLDGQPLALDGSDWELQHHGSHTLLTTSRQEAARDFIGQIRNGDWLRFRDLDARIPLAGLTAALLRMDERQQRLDTRTALIRRGSAPADSVPPPPPLPRLERGTRPSALTNEEEKALRDSVQVLHAARLDDDCYGAMHRMTPLAAQAWPIDDSHALVAIPCTLTNILQLQSFLYIAARGNGGPIQLFQPVLHFEGRPQPITIRALSEVDFEPERGRLFASQKNLGSASCGYAGEWQWQDGAFILAGFMHQNRCGGSIPGDWPVLYRSETANPP